MGVGSAMPKLTGHKQPSCTRHKKLINPLLCHSSSSQGRIVLLYSIFKKELSSVFIAYKNRVNGLHSAIFHFRVWSQTLQIININQTNRD